MTDVNEVLSAPLMRIKLVALVHFLFLSNSMAGNSSGYFFYNVLFMVALFWTIHCKDSVDAVETAIVIDACSIILDIISFILGSRSLFAWSIVFAIFNLLLRPLSSFLLFKEYSRRGGSAIATGSIFPSSQQRSYQDIDRPTQPVPSNNAQPGQNVAVIF